MKVIISHDIDHITAAEHLGDLFLAKYFIRNSAELITKNITLAEYGKRILNIRYNRLNNVVELAEFDLKNNLRTTFFLAVNNGLGLSYKIEKACIIAEYLDGKGIPLGLHGISFDDYENICYERSAFVKMTGQTVAGIRMHYLRLNSETQKFLAKADYLFDSSDFSLKNPYKVDNLWEFPIHLMDTYLFYGDSRFQRKSLDQIKLETSGVLERAEKSGIEYFNIITHDVYFSEAFIRWKSWYVWLTGFLSSNGYQFVTYNEAIKNLNSFQ